MLHQHSPSICYLTALRLITLKNKLGVWIELVIAYTGHTLQTNKVKTKITCNH